MSTTKLSYYSTGRIVRLGYYPKAWISRARLLSSTLFWKRLSYYLTKCLIKLLVRALMRGMIRIKVDYSLDNYVTFATAYAVENCNGTSAKGSVKYQDHNWCLYQIRMVDSLCCTVLYAKRKEIVKHDTERIVTNRHAWLAHLLAVRTTWAVAHQSG